MTGSKFKLMGWTAPQRHQRARMRSLIAISPRKGTVHGTDYHDRVGPGEERLAEPAPAQAGVHGVGAAGQVVVRKLWRRAEVLRFFERLPPCLVGMEACATAHYWAREPTKLGHTVRLMPPAYVKPGACPGAGRGQARQDRRRRCCGHRGS